MPAEPTAKLTFLPWVRTGVASAITEPETLSPQRAIAEVRITLAVNDAPLPEKTVQLRGPADVLGIDLHQIVRTDPRPGATAFESNCFASIEFDRPDFAWLFTPARATEDGRLRPWLCLVVVRQQPGVSLANEGNAPLPVLRIATAARPSVELPDPKDSWAWAHAQVAADGGVDPNAVVNALTGAPELSLSRLVCPRVLAPDTSYVACLVPAFELGRRAGRGVPITDAELAATDALQPAWTLDDTRPVELPVYYSWEFRSGPGGDFATLARRLRKSIPHGVGRRTVDIAQSGFEFEIPPGDPATIEVEGALRSLSENASTVEWSGPLALSFEKHLAEIVNRPELARRGESGERALLAPPLYGRWHAARGIAIPLAPRWFDQLNLDPRWRIAAAIGTRVVQQHQEALMASAWEQAADAQQVNRRLRQLQLSMAVGERLHARHLMRFSDELTLRAASPVFSRLRVASGEPLGQTLTALILRSALPVHAVSTAMRRIGRQRGPLSRRVAAQGVPRSADKTWVRHLNRAFDPGAAALVPLDHAVPPPLPSASDVAAAAHNSGFRVVAEREPVPPLPGVDPLPADWDYPGFFRAAAVEHLSRIRSDLNVQFQFRQSMDEVESVATVREKMHPRVALAKLARAIVTVSADALPPTAAGVTPTGVETVMFAPSFPQAMYEPLKELSQDLLLPGLDKLEPDTVSALQTHRAFVEAYLIGLNFEMGRELLWRGFPTDQQGTYFKRFWQYDANDSATDIPDLRADQARALGSAAADAPDQFVLLMRSVLLQRYPNALVYLSPTLSDASVEAPADVFPIFSGRLEPDVSVFGFPLSPSAAIGTPESGGYFVVIEEHPTEPRFGLDVPPEGVSHIAVATLSPDAKQSAQVAALTRRRPVRIAIHASQLVAKPAPGGVS